jgi:hypothetical protein
MQETKKALLVFAVAFVLNFIWEKSHMVLYDIAAIPMAPWWILVRATFWDAVIITGVYIFFDTPQRAKRYILSVLICLGVAILLNKEQWWKIDGNI